MDDGADVIGVLHSARREQLGDIIAGTEETTTGVIRLKALEADGKLGFPIIAVNEAKTETSYFSTSAAATSSWVESGLEAQRTMSAPPALSVRIRFAVSVVTASRCCPCRRLPRSVTSSARRPAIST